MATDISLIDNSGVTWIRRPCRCCRAALWQVLGEPTGLCRGCARVAGGDPLGILRIENDAEQVLRFHTLQYHGVCAFDV